MRFDHFVIHVEPGADAASEIALKSEPLGLKFDPVGNRNFESFAAWFLYIGTEYLEIVELKKPNESGWVPQWVSRFNQGVRGVYCVFLGTSKIENLEARLRSRGFDVRAERSEFVDSNGTSHPFPWRQIYMPPIPGTDIEISFIQYDATSEELREIFTPNSDENGLVGIRQAELSIPRLADAEDFLKRIFPSLQTQVDGFKIEFENGNLFFRESPEPQLRLEVNSTEEQRRTGEFSISNVTMKTVSKAK